MDRIVWFSIALINLSLVLTPASNTQFKPFPLPEFTQQKF